MSSDRRSKVEALLGRALAVDTTARLTFLVEACAGDDALLAEVVGLLEASAFDSAGDAGEAEPGSGTATRPDGNRQLDDERPLGPHDDERLVVDPARILNTTFDDLYYVEAFLGRGGMGVVYRARHVLLKDVVALKLMPRDIGSRPESLHRFMREGQAARRFRHSNAVVVHDLRLARDGTPYLVLEYVPGWTLRVEMKCRGRFAPRDALAIVEPIASVLDAAHAAGVVHRDLKPDNVMLVDDPSGERTVKVLDLGVAKIYESAAEQGADATVAGTVLGTPYYMSPEQWGAPQRDGDPDVDGRSDLYSLAILTFELLAGAHPFPADGFGEIRRNHLFVKPPPVGDVVPGLPSGLEQAIARAHSKDRADRQETAGEFARQLRAALENGEPDGPRHSAYAATVVEVPSGATDAGEAGTGLRGIPNNVPWPMQSYAAECLAVANALGFKALAAGATEVLAEVASERGDLALARTLLCDTLAMRRDLGYKDGIAASLERLACLAAATGDTERAVRLAAAANRIRTATGSPPSAPERDILERYLAHARSALGADGTERALRWTAETEIDAAVSFALDGASAGDPDA